jgi:hypothetical protein
MTRRKQGPDSDVATLPVAGNFHDLDSLLEHLGDPPIFQLGHPLPNERFMPKPRAGKCPATHNDLLLRKADD